LESLCNIIVVLFIRDILNDDRWDRKGQGEKDLVFEIIDRKATKDNLKQWLNQPVEKCKNIQVTKSLKGIKC